MDHNDNQRTNRNVRGQLNFNQRWGRHEVIALAGAEASETNQDRDMHRLYGYDPETNTFSGNMDFLDQYLIRASFHNHTKVLNRDGSGGSLNRFRSYYANGAYTYNDRYTFSISGRKDGANLFGVKTNNKITPLWSAGLSWTISKEKFYHISWLSYLKLRATYGYNGNIKNDVTTFTTISYGNNGGDPLTGAQFAQIASPPNPALRWEQVRMVNLGLDFESASHRISGSVEYYHKRGLDLISQITVDPTRGFDNYTGNNASIKGKGIDVTINTTNIDRKFKWYTNFLLSYNTDKVTSYEVEPVQRS